MRAVQLRSGRHHWVFDQRSTYCGRWLIDLPVLREFTTEHLPAGDVCVECESARQSGLVQGAHHVTLPPSWGTVRKTGPLHHGTQSFGVGHGKSRLPRHEG